MAVPSSCPFSTRQLRRSLKRGLARQAMAAARARQADHEPVFAELRRLAPSRKAMERCVLRLRKCLGIVSAGLAGDRLVVVMRNCCVLHTKAEGIEAFREDALIYTRIVAAPGKQKVGILINRVSFSRHALERFVERGDCAVDREILPIIDAEAAAMLRHAMEGELFEQNEDGYLRARAEGVWAGSLDHGLPDADWAMARSDACVPTFSARTFLGPDEMRPEVWLRWQADPSLSLAA